MESVRLPPSHTFFRVHNVAPGYRSSDPGTIESNRALSTGQEVGIKIATPAGVLLGQLLFGWLGDVLGRKRICTSSHRFTKWISLMTDSQ